MPFLVEKETGKMNEPKTGFEYLEKMREKKRKDPAFSSYRQYLEIKAREKGIPLNGQFELTPLCNFDCKMCYVHLTKQQMEGPLPLSAADWKELMGEAWECGMVRATLTGGECLTYPGFKEIYLYLQSLGCQVTVLTNAYLLDENWCCFFKEHPPESIRVTLYGSDDDSYERVTGQRVFGRVRDNILRLKEAGIPLTMTVTPTSLMGDSVFETIRLAKSITTRVIVSPGLYDAREETGRDGSGFEPDPFYYLKVYRYVDELDGIDVMPVPEDSLPEAGGDGKTPVKPGILCGGGRSSFAIDWKGILHPCSSLPDVRAFPMKDGFKNAWDSINKAVSAWPATQECEGCAYSSICTRCPAYMMRFASPGTQPVEMCERIRYLVKNGVWHIPEFD